MQPDTLWIILGLALQGIGLLFGLEKMIRSDVKNAIELEHRLTKIETMLEQIKNGQLRGQ